MRYWVLLSCFVCLLASAQAEGEHMFDEWQQGFYEILWSDSDSASQFLDLMEEHAAKTRLRSQHAALNSAKGTYFYSLGLYDKALDFYTKAYDFSQKEGDQKMQGKMLFNIGNCHYEEHDFDRAQTAYASALRLFEQLSEEEWILNAKYAKANVLHDMGDFTAAVLIYADLEQVYLDRDAVVYAGYANLGMGSCYAELGRHEDALKHFDLALQRAAVEKDAFTHAMILNKRASVYLDLNQANEAIEDFQKSLTLSRLVDNKKQIYKSYRGLARSHFKLGQIQAAQSFYELSIDYKDSVFNEEKQAQYALNDVRFNTALNMETIALQEALLQEKNRTILALVVAAVVLLTLLILLIWTYGKLKRNRLQLEKSLVEKDALLREIHHRVKNNLQVVSSLLNMHVRKVTDPKSKAILEEGADRVLAMSIIHKNLYQHTDLKTVSLDDYLFKLCNQLFDNYQASDAAVELKTELSPVSVDVDRLIPIGLIVNELISNAMKHAFDETQHAQIHVKLAQGLHNQIELEISDNGIGIDDAVNLQHSESIGMKLIRIFSQKLNSLVEINNNNGTRVKLSIPLG